MAMGTTWQRPDLETLAAMIARSQIVVAQALARPALVRSWTRQLPAGFDAADIAVLDWIAAEGRRASRSLVRL
jgi:hypothetical protein